MTQVMLTPDVQQALTVAPQAKVRQTEQAFADLERDPWAHSFPASTSDDLRIRAFGDLRVIYKVDEEENVVYVFSVFDRQDVTEHAR
jgi:mRNA-degrading endonuclease RelE of RelBE toxin-antitoxin system